ncbi:MAG: hypothetical protein KF681_08785 [Bdellovibrionaceae bacterium]|nr:hypothetical protein [Pseudobdellovibrionaceae bacterium]
MFKSLFASVLLLSSVSQAAHLTSLEAWTAVRCEIKVCAAHDRGQHFIGQCRSMGWDAPGIDGVMAVPKKGCWCLCNLDTIIKVQQ